MNFTYSININDLIFEAPSTKTVFIVPPFNVSKFLESKRSKSLEYLSTLFFDQYLSDILVIPIEGTCDTSSKVFYFAKKFNLKEFSFICNCFIEPLVSKYYKKIKVERKDDKYPEPFLNSIGTKFVPSFLKFDYSFDDKSFIILDCVHFKKSEKMIFDYSDMKEILIKLIQKWKPDFIKAHGTGTKANDKMESEIYNSFDIPVVFYKWKFGHLKKNCFVEDLFIFENFIKESKVVGPPYKPTLLKNYVQGEIKIKKDTIRIISVSIGFGGYYTILVEEFNK